MCKCDPDKNITRMSRVLYWGSGSAPCWRVQVALEEKGLEYESKLVSFSNKEHKSPEVLALNPRGQLPTFKDGDAVVNESLAVLLYLQMKYPQKSLMPQDKMPQVLQRLQEGANLDGAMRGVAIAKRNGDEPGSPAFEEKLEALKKELQYWEGYLDEGQGYLVGDSLTLADLNAGLTILYLQRLGASYNDFLHIKQYAEKLKAVPSIDKTWPPHWRESPNQDWLKL